MFSYGTTPFGVVIFFAPQGHDPFSMRRGPRRFPAVRENPAEPAGVDSICIESRRREGNPLPAFGSFALSFRRGRVRGRLRGGLPGPGQQLGLLWSTQAA